MCRRRWLRQLGDMWPQVGAPAQFLPFLTLAPRSKRNSVPNLASQMRVAFSRIASKTDFTSPDDELITLSTSAAAISRSNASSRSRRRRADSLSSARTVVALRRFGIALRLRALVGLLLALERRRIAFPKAQDKAL